MNVPDSDSMATPAKPLAGGDTASSVDDRRRELLRLCVADALQSTPTIDASATFEDALPALQSSKDGYLVVVGADGRVEGMLEGRAIAAAWASSPVDFDRSLVRDVEEAHAVIPDYASIGDAAAVMLRIGTRAVAVTNRRQMPLGTISADAIVALLAQQKPR